MKPDDAALNLGVLLEASPRGTVNRVLWFHQTDRWYFGDFLRHAAWLRWLYETFPTATIDLASHPEYLRLYQDQRFANLYDVRSSSSGVVFAAYDLVVAPTAQEPVTYDDSIALLLATWDTGWALVARGMVVVQGAKTQLNYFRAAHPSAIFGEESTCTTPILFTEAETLAASEMLQRNFPGDVPVIVYNPSASNPFTRDTGLPKEVDNSLSAAEHAQVLRHVLTLLPDHHVIVGSALKPNDLVNVSVIEAITGSVVSNRVTSILDLPLPQMTTLRGFAGLLTIPQVRAITGAGTGTNTHLAAITGTVSLSVERGADAQMRENWARPADFQMGSFRWRNPALTVATHTLDWHNKTPAALKAVADAFVSHYQVFHDVDQHEYQQLFTDPVNAAGCIREFLTYWPQHRLPAIDAASRLLEFLSPAAQRFYGCFDDEAAYLQLRYNIKNTQIAALRAGIKHPDHSLQNVAAALFADSNLHKFLQRQTSAASR